MRKKVLFLMLVFSVIFGLLLIVNSGKIKVLAKTNELFEVPSQNKSITGDVNGDGQVSDADAIHVLMHMFFSEDYPVNQNCDFNGDNEVTDADAIYLLMHTFFPDEYPIVRSIDIIWKNGSTILKLVENVAPDEEKSLVYDGPIPTKASDMTYFYVFSKWVRSENAGGKEVIYSAVFLPVYIDYTIVFENYDKTVLSSKQYHYGDSITMPITPTRAYDNTYTYSFNGWDKTVTNCVGNATYTATFNSVYRNYQIVFKNANGDVISSKDYHFGDTVQIPSSPKKDSDNVYDYVFAGWDKPIVNCVASTTYIAQYTPVLREYIIEFKDYDNTLISFKKYHYGDSIQEPSNPTRERDAQYTYTFKQWNKPVSICTESTTYVAEYSSTVNQYKIVWLNYDASELEIDENVDYGTMLHIPLNR